MRGLITASLGSFIFLSGCTLFPTNDGHQNVRYSLALPRPVTVKLPSGEIISPQIDQERSYPEITVPHAAEINRYIPIYRKGVTQAIARREQYREEIEEIFTRYGLPLELINLGILESGFNPNARSNQGAVGVWQFMPGTARIYGLKVNGKIDERRDVIKSSVAAAKHLSELYSLFGDWQLVLAAFNSGPGKISSAVYKHGTRDFFELARKNAIPKETKEFVPKFLAITLICKDITPFQSSRYLASNSKFNRFSER
jgi:hypothetical protein